VYITTTSNAIYPPTLSSPSIYTPYTPSTCTVLLNPTPSDTLSEGPKIRLAVGLKPRWIKKNEPWGGRKVADFIAFTEEPGGVVLERNKINWQPGF